MIAILLLRTSFPEPKGQLTRNLVGSIGATYRSKIAKIVIGNPRRLPWWPSWKSISWTKRPIDLKLGNIGATCRKKIAKSSGWKSKMAIMFTILKIYFALLIQNRKGKWRESIGVTCRSKIDNSLRSEIQDGHYIRHLENLFCASPPELKAILHETK